MEKFTIYTGTSVPLMHDNIDTDQIIPKSYLKQVDKSGFGKHLFDEWRYLEDGSPNKDFVLNDPDYQDATILIAGENFGSGSSREHAAWAIQDYGFRVVIAGSFSDIFFMNALKNGLLPIKMAKNIREKIAALPAGTPVTIDLPQQKVRLLNESFDFPLEEAWKQKLIHGLDDISITLQYEDAIAAYEKTNAK